MDIYEFDKRSLTKNSGIDKKSFENILDENESTLIVLYTNILLALAEVSYYASKNLLQIFDKCKDLLWIPYQVNLEFEKNMYEVFGNMYKKYEKLLEKLNDKAKKLENDINFEFERYSKYDDSVIKDLKEEVINNLQELSKIVENYTKKKEEIIRTDKKQIKELQKEILSFVDILKTNNRLGNCMKFSEVIETIKEGDLRYKYKMPPGFLDEYKKTADQFGDLYIWKEIVHLPEKFSAERSTNIKNILFVTNDIKGDWWETKKDNKGQNIKQDVMRDELFLEFNEINPDTSIKFMKLNIFHEYASEIYDLYDSDVYIELNKDDEEYTNKIRDKVAKEIIDQINNNNCIDELNFEDAGIDNMHVYNCVYRQNLGSVINKIDNSAKINYKLEFIVDLVGYSSSRNIYSCYNMHGPSEIKEHNMSLSVIVSVDRIIENTKSDNLIQELKKDNEFKNFKIISAKIIKYKVSREEDKYSDNECLNDDEYSSSEGFICPICGRKFKDLSNEMGGVCLECYQTNFDL